ncbi:LvhB11 [Perkinsela sp. CCAP 1560/4]|nr:LvhB11 [Perkinsela sp. CCAP 1560/4]|eukprot:KNH03631.1 LvhB11 [Perkinsela sp. CCAP 1560/4]
MGPEVKINITERRDDGEVVKSGELMSINQHQDRPLNPNLHSNIVKRIDGLQHIMNFSHVTSGEEKTLLCDCVSNSGKHMVVESLIFVRTRVVRLTKGNLPSSNLKDTTLHAFSFTSSTSAGNVKSLLEGCSFVEASRIRLLLNGQNIESNNSLHSIGIRANDILEANLLMSEISSKTSYDGHNCETPFSATLQLDSCCFLAKQLDVTTSAITASRVQLSNEKKQLIVEDIDSFLLSTKGIFGCEDKRILLETPRKATREDSVENQDLVRTLPHRLRCNDSRCTEITGELLKKNESPRKNHQYNYGRTRNTVEDEKPAQAELFTQGDLSTTSSLSQMKSVVHLPGHGIALNDILSFLTERRNKNMTNCALDLFSQLLLTERCCHKTLSSSGIIRLFDDFLFVVTSEEWDKLNVYNLAYQLFHIATHELVMKLNLTSSLICSGSVSDFDLVSSVRTIRTNYSLIAGTVFDMSFILYAIIRANIAICGHWADTHQKAELTHHAELAFSVISHFDNLLNINFALNMFFQVCLCGLRTLRPQMVRVFAWRLLLFAHFSIARSTENCLAGALNPVPCVFAIIFLQTMHPLSKAVYGIQPDEALFGEVRDALRTVSIASILEEGPNASENENDPETSFGEQLSQLHQVAHCGQAEVLHEMLGNIIDQLLESLRSMEVLPSLEKMIYAYPGSVEAVQLLNRHQKRIRGYYSEHKFTAALQAIIEDLVNENEIVNSQSMRAMRRIFARKFTRA